MGCTQGRPSSLNSPNPSLHKLKMANGYVPGGGGGGGGFGDHHTNNHQSRRPPVGQRRFGSGNGRVFRQESMINAVKRHSSGRTSSDSNEGEEEKRRSNGSENGRSSRPESEEKRPAVKEEQESSKGSGSSGSGSRRIMEVGKVVDDEDQMVDGWPKWLTDNVPRDALDGLTPRSAETYDKIDKVGQGTYSNVYKARDKYTGKVVALKKVRFDTSEPESVKFMAREIRILRKLDHPNVVKLEGLATSRMHYSIYLVFDYMQSDLSTIICRPDERLTEPQVKSYMQQLLSGLQHCHERGILHRDIKGSNLLIDRKGMLKIADFGLANYYNPEKRRPLTSRVVTLWYRAPELLLGATEYGTGIDLWSVGCLMAEMFTGKPIMPGRTEVEQLHKIFKLCGTPSEDFWKRVKLPTTFRPPQTYKPKLKEFFKNFPSSSFGLLNTLLALDPAKRGSAASALHDRFFYTMPMACDLSGLPAINKLPEDEPITPVDTRRQRSSKMRHRSQSLVVHRPKEKEETQQEEDSDAYAAQEKSAETMILSQGPGSSSTRSTYSSVIKQTITLTTSSSSSSSSSKKIEEKVISPPPHLSSPPYNPKISSRTEEYVQSIKINSNIVPKNRPPLPEARRSHHYNNNNNNSSNNNNNGNNYMFRQGNDQVSRSVSTREFRNLDRNKLLELHAVD